MPLDLDFDYPLNVSLQVGDVVYMTATGSSGGFNTASQGGISILGVVLAINWEDYIVTVDSALGDVPNNSFILFSKNTVENLSSMLGYYLRVEFRNSSTQYAELFQTGVDMFESSK
jgi:hypothetical protein